MDQAKLRNIIDDKNHRREESVLREAAALIDEIAAEQQRIAISQERILKLRKELSELEAAILG